MLSSLPTTITRSSSTLSFYSDHCARGSLLTPNPNWALLLLHLDPYAHNPMPNLTCRCPFALQGPIPHACCLPICVRAPATPATSGCPVCIWKAVKVRRAGEAGDCRDRGGQQVHGWRKREGLLDARIGEGAYTHVACAWALGVSMLRVPATP